MERTLGIGVRRYQGTDVGVPQEQLWRGLKNSCGDVSRDRCGEVSNNRFEEVPGASCGKVLRNPDKPRKRARNIHL